MKLYLSSIPQRPYQWYLTSATGIVPHDSNGTIYFRRNESRLFNCTPTWFDSPKEAMAAGEAAGFKVVDLARA